MGGQQNKTAPAMFAEDGGDDTPDPVLVGRPLEEVREEFLQRLLDLDDQAIRQGLRGVRILALDGGGTRGVSTLEFLKKLEHDTGKKICELFDLIIGTSTGGILAIGVGLLQMDCAEVAQLYDSTMNIVFPPTTSEIKGSKIVSNLPIYSAQTLASLFYRETFNLDMEAIQFPKVFVIAAEITTTKPVPVAIGNTSPEDDFFSEIKMWRAVRASSAAPLYFKPCRIGNRVFADGGLLQNNPTKQAIYQAKKIWPDAPIDLIVSLGTGEARADLLCNTSYHQLGQLQGLVSEIVGETYLTHLDVLDICKLLPKPPVYIRWNVHDLGMRLDETQQDKLAELKAQVTTFMQTPKFVEEYAKLIACLK